MSEAERVEAIKSLQMQLFELKREYLLTAKKLKRQLSMVQDCGLKMCRKCRVEMDVEQFAVDRSKADGRDSYCSECRRGYYESKKRLKAA